MKKIFLLFGILLCLTIVPGTIAKADSEIGETEDDEIVESTETIEEDLVELETEDSLEVNPENTVANEIAGALIDMTAKLRQTIPAIKVRSNVTAISTTAASVAMSEKEKEKAPYYTITDEEYQILYQIVEAEATDGTIEQKKNVASCIFARYESNEWPNSVKGVVFQKSQFSPLSDGRYYSVTVTDSTKEAVNYIVQNGKEHNYIFFCSYGCKSSWFAKKDQKLAAQGKECYRDGIHRYYLD